MKKIIMIMFILSSFSFVWAGDDHIQLSCPGGVQPNDSMINTTKLHIKNGIKSTTKYTVKKDVCYKVTQARFIHLFDKQRAAYGIRLDHDQWPYTAPQLFLFEYLGSAAAKSRKVSAVVKFTGEYFNYKTEEGIPKVMPIMYVVKENKIR